MPANTPPIEELERALEKARSSLEHFSSEGVPIQMRPASRTRYRETICSIDAAINALPQLLSLAKLALLVREGGEEVENALAGELNFQLYQSPEPDDRGRAIARAVLRTLEGLVK